MSLGLLCGGRFKSHQYRRGVICAVCRRCGISEIDALLERKRRYDYMRTGRYLARAPLPLVSRPHVHVEPASVKLARVAVVPQPGDLARALLGARIVSRF